VKALRGVKAYANTQHARQATDVAYAAYMLKQGGKQVSGKGVTKWQKRWVVLKANGDIVYYKDNKTNHMQGVLRLQGFCVRAAFLSAARFSLCFVYADRMSLRKPPFAT
jgi:hypothetical protein